MVELVNHLFTNPQLSHIFPPGEFFINFSADIIISDSK